jgi:hypothetical protein
MSGKVGNPKSPDMLYIAVRTLCDTVRRMNAVVHGSPTCLPIHSIGSRMDKWQLYLLFCVSSLTICPDHHSCRDKTHNVPAALDVPIQQNQTISDSPSHKLFFKYSIRRPTVHNHYHLTRKSYPSQCILPGGLRTEFGSEVWTKLRTARHETFSAHIAFNTQLCTKTKWSPEEITDTDNPKTVNDWLTLLRINSDLRLRFINPTKKCSIIWLTKTCIPQTVFRVTMGILCEDYHKNSFFARVHKQLGSLLRCSSFTIQLFVLYWPVRDFQQDV